MDNNIPDTYTWPSVELLTWNNGYLGQFTLISANRWIFVPGEHLPRVWMPGGGWH
jgi:hypothetical protein